MVFIVGDTLRHQPMVAGHMVVPQFRGPITYCVLQWCHPMLTGTQRRTSCSTRMITLFGDHVIKLDSGPRIQHTNAMSLISIALNFNSKSEPETLLLIQKIVPAIAAQRNYKFVIATQYDSVRDSARSATVDWVATSNTWTEGQVWNQLVRRVKTPFVLIGRDMTMFTGQVNFARLLKVMSIAGSPIVGGSIKTVEDGHWSLNCLQMLHYNYSIFYQLGYHKSEESCLYCDYIWGPFVAENQFLLSHRLL